ncbi:extracellular triacylglycerol lipase precursor [Mycena vitilis]|nr:extracellular triacylglycerol lipase precursor [Mycena vitilis]
MKLQSTFFGPLVQLGTAASPAIQLGNTTLVGLNITTFQQDLFAGIPFAEPPLNNLRFTPPVPKILQPGAFNASTFGPACLQTAVSYSVTPDSMSEDCLTINILRPTGTAANASLPVMFWTYGGGYNAGFSELYNASSLVAQSVARGTPVIHASFNYRLGPLGFPQGNEADKQGALNLGIKDQIAVLQWVQLHIEAFGGDKGKVTVFGQSAGSIMASILFLNYPIASLARAAIFESGSQSTLPLYPPERRERTWETFVRGVPSCASRATSGATFGCLRSANTTEIFDAMSAVMAADIELFPFQPVIDGPEGLIPDRPSAFLNRGQFARLPFIAGTNLDEGTLLVDPAVNSSTEIFKSLQAQYSPSLSAAALNESIDTLLRLYPDIPSLGSPFGTGNETFGLSSQYKRAAAIQGDQWFQSQRRVWMERAAQAGLPTFAYLFTQPTAGRFPTLGVAHDDEIPYVYGLPVDSSPSAILLSQLMPNYWISFATSLTPNDGLGVPRPEWPQFTPNNKVVLQLNGANTTVIPDDYRKEQIAYTNSQPAIWSH